jgi:ribosomal protein S18 acetylase RimI-like enzyme/uridine kinase
LSGPTFVIAIAGHSGAGKSTIIEKLVLRLGNASSLSLDAYESSSTYPPAAKWIEDGADPNEFQTPQFDADIRALKNGKSIIHPETGLEIKPDRFLIIEEPFGRGRGSLHNLIDFVVYIDTPLEVAYARKLLRKSEFLPWEDNPDVFITNLRQNMEWYLRTGRKFYLAVSDGVQKNCDLIVDGTLPVDTIADAILARVAKMTAIITPERPDTPDAQVLIAELEALLEPFYPRESRHGYSVEKLITEGVAFFLIREAGVPAGCGGIQLHGTEYGEIKRMYVRPQFRGLGFARLMLNHLEDYARSHGVRLLRLETGIHQQAAIGLYERMGFRRIPPFGEYREDPLSRYYEKDIRESYHPAP